MPEENQTTDKKSLRKLKEHKELARDCVAFANAHGGIILIGIEDHADEPPASQQIQEREIEHLQKRIGQVTLNVSSVAQKKVAANGGEYIELSVFPNRQSIASTSDGRYYIRVSDECHPLMPDELIRLMNDKSAFTWETQPTGNGREGHVDEEKLWQFRERIQSSDRVTSFVKGKSNEELLQHYLFVRDGILTNLGVLWIGRREDRAMLRHAPAVQCIKYDELGRKINKWVWDDYSQNPLELLEEVWKTIPDWQEGYELPDGLFRKTVPHYDEVVVRELLANALVHRPYTQRGDIFLNLHPDRLEVHNPGLLPVGVTPRNILHTSVKRNEHLAKVFYDLGLMEREGSGYDRIYEVLLTAGKQLPEVREDHDRVTVTVYKRMGDPRILEFIHKADETFSLSQKEKITLGILAQHESLTAIELRNILKVGQETDMQHWLGRLPGWDLVLARGRTKGRSYSVNPELLRTLQFRGTTSLRNIEEHRLRELILRDLEIYHEASSSEIHKRIGPEIPIHRLRRALRNLVKDNSIAKKGAKKGTKYFYKS